MNNIIVAISKAERAKPGYKPSKGQFSYDFENVELTLEQFASEINEGYSFTSQHTGEKIVSML